MSPRQNKKGKIPGQQELALENTDRKESTAVEPAGNPNTKAQETPTDPAKKPDSSPPKNQEVGADAKEPKPPFSLPDDLGIGGLKAWLAEISPLQKEDPK